MGDLNLPRLVLARRPIVLGAIVLLVAVVAACSGSATVPENGEGPGANSPGEILGSIEQPSPDETRSPGEIVIPEFDASAFARINPDTEIRALNRDADLKGEFDYYEENRIPRDAINPVYSPVFITPSEATLSPKELVMGLEINGDARAYPVGMMRIREMVNDEVGGTPVLVTW